MISTTLQDVRDGQELKVIGRRISVLNEEKSKLKRKIGWRQQDMKPCYRENRQLHQISVELVDLDVDRRLITGDLTYTEVYGQ